MRRQLVREIRRLRVRESSLPILDAVANLVCRFNDNGSFYACTNARHTNELRR